MSVKRNLADAFSDIERWDYRVDEVKIGQAACAELLNEASPPDIDLVSDPRLRATGFVANLWGSRVVVDRGMLGWHVALTPGETPGYPFPSEKDLRVRCIGGHQCDEPDCVIRSVLES